MNPREAITKQVHALLERETRINLHRHPVEIHNANGVVVLEGELPDVAAKKLALERAASVRGVDGIVDRLRVSPGERRGDGAVRDSLARDRKSTRLNSSHSQISYAVFCLKKKKRTKTQ